MTKPEQGQNILDLAIQYCGDASAAFEIALLNGFSLTDDLAADKVLELPAEVDIAIANYFKNNGLVPATGTSILGMGTPEEEIGGIEYWAIGETFIVS